MFIQTKCNELSFADLIRATKDTTDESKKFPYKTFVARCGNCQFCYKGKCSLKECCCMRDRVKAGSCSFTELLNHCFRNIGDNVFRFRLRIAAERAAEEHSCFLSKEHFKRFREGCALTHRNDNGFIAQLFLLSADETLVRFSESSVFRLLSVRSPVMKRLSLWWIPTSNAKTSFHPKRHLLIK